MYAFRELTVPMRPCIVKICIFVCTCFWVAGLWENWEQVDTNRICVQGIGGRNRPDRICCLTVLYAFQGFRPQANIRVTQSCYDWSYLKSLTIISLTLPYVRATDVSWAQSRDEDMGGGTLNHALVWYPAHCPWLRFDTVCWCFIWKLIVIALHQSSTFEERTTLFVPTIALWTLFTSSRPSVEILRSKMKCKVFCRHTVSETWGEFSLRVPQAQFR